eukprot:TRINITY_DN4764_c0_g1_i6.p1 TRINITY_DN4764_c0_g1~~TRINITY_DN4764_c0_g1_i6.p1  ORF type:complete len:332 (-),score=41.42 TRINITY_DN4764_c0_g1_i6:216-1211(-)
MGYATTAVYVAFACIGCWLLYTYLSGSRSLYDILTSILVRQCQNLQKAFPSARLMFEFNCMATEFARNMAVQLPNKTLFHFMNGAFCLCMRCVYTYGTSGGKFDRVTQISDDLFLLRYFNIYLLGKQVTESVLVRTEGEAILYGVCVLTPEIQDLIGNRRVVTVLQQEHHHKWLSTFMDRYPKTTITGSKVAFRKHTSQLDRCFVYIPLEEVVFPDSIYVAQIPGVADEEFLLLHKEQQLLFSAHFFANPVVFAGMEGRGWFLRKALELVLFSSMLCEAWDGLPTDNPVLDRAVLMNFKAELEKQGRWTRVHGSHVGLLPATSSPGSKRAS